MPLELGFLLGQEGDLLRTGSKYMTRREVLPRVQGGELRESPGYANINGPAEPEG